MDTHTCCCSVSHVANSARPNLDSYHVVPPPIGATLPGFGPATPQRTNTSPPCLLQRSTVTHASRTAKSAFKRADIEHNASPNQWMGLQSHFMLTVRAKHGELKFAGVSARAVYVQYATHVHVPVVQSSTWRMRCARSGGAVNGVVTSSTEAEWVRSFFRYISQVKHNQFNGDVINPS